MIGITAHETSEALARSALTAAQRWEMLGLLSRYFDGVDAAQFERDLSEKDWVLQLRRDGRLVGFSTILSTQAQFEGETATVIYSGDTIVAPEAWGTPALARAWIAKVNAIRAESTAQRCYWLLLTSGFRTYRFLPVFWREFHPRRGTETPQRARMLMRSLAAARYGEAYNEETGIVRFPRPQRLSGAMAAIPDARRGDPDVAFFLERNPGHGLGDELVCLTEITEGNLTPAGWRMVSAIP
jgi:hypothetical protein